MCTCTFDSRLFFPADSLHSSIKMMLILLLLRGNVDLACFFLHRLVSLEGSFPSVCVRNVSVNQKLRHRSLSTATNVCPSVLVDFGVFRSRCVGSVHGPGSAVHRTPHGAPFHRAELTCLSEVVLLGVHVSKLLAGSPLMSFVNSSPPPCS